MFLVLRLRSDRRKSRRLGILDLELIRVGKLLRARCKGTRPGTVVFFMFHPRVVPTEYFTYSSKKHVSSIIGGLS